jgi:hypothetical protein
MKGHSKALAASATFLMSGLIHEYLLFVLCCPEKLFYLQQDANTIDSTCTSFLGFNLAFFVYNGVLILLEYAFIGILLHQRIVQLYLPAPLMTSMVILTALPVAHWFTDAYADCNIYESLKVGCPLVLKQI